MFCVYIAVFWSHQPLKVLYISGHIHPYSYLLCMGCNLEFIILPQVTVNHPLMAASNRIMLHVTKQKLNLLLEHGSEFIELQCPHSVPVIQAVVEQDIYGMKEQLTNQQELCDASMEILLGGHVAVTKIVVKAPVNI